jgi:AcrR family transcriptional regulator
LGSLAALEVALEGSRRGARARAKQDMSDLLRTTALRMFLARGFDGVTVNEIAEAAGVTSRTFFRYFPTKETVIVDAFDQSNRRLVELIAVPTDKPMLDAVRDASRRWFEEYGQFMDLLAHFTVSSTSLSAALRHRQSVWEEHLAEAISTARPSSTARFARIWGALTFTLVDLTHSTALEQSSTPIDVIDEVFDDFARAVLPD